jgi:hypothetical protein
MNWIEIVTEIKSNITFKQNKNKELKWSNEVYDLEAETDIGKYTIKKNPTTKNYKIYFDLKTGVKVDRIPFTITNAPSLSSAKEMIQNHYDFIKLNKE